jgi:hypothetical protein
MQTGQKKKIESVVTLVADMLDTLKEWKQILEEKGHEVDNEILEIFENVRIFIIYTDK